jgi:hypothetical protein
MGGRRQRCNELSSAVLNFTGLQASVPFLLGTEFRGRTPIETPRDLTTGGSVQTTQSELSRPDLPGTTALFILGWSHKVV